MDPVPHSPLCDDTSTSREDALIVAARRQAEAATPLTPGSGSTSPKSDANGAARFLTDAMPGYDPIGEMHRGGQGVVYEAIQKSTRRRVAIKIMRDGAFASPADLARFDREILALAQLKHPNIVTIYESGASQGRRYFVMDFIHGLPLDAYVAQMRPSLTELLQLFVKIAAAVSAAHDRGIVHRDLKPSNIRISADGEPHILDFGLAKLAQNTLESLFEGDSDVRGLAHTVTGQFVGSPPWASPEQARAHHDEVDIRSDVYSLGIILYHLLVNAFPYDVSEGGMHAVLDRIIHADPVPLRRRRPDLDADLDTIVMKCLEKEPDRRYSSAGALGDDLSLCIKGNPIRARRDRVLYVIRKRTGGWLRAHPIAACLAVLAISCLFARFVGRPLIYGPTKVDAWFEHQAMSIGLPDSSRIDLTNVRVISLPPPDEIRKLVNEFELNGVDPDVKDTWRRLYGRLMEILAKSGVTTVVWDLAFVRETSFDIDFIRGIHALNEVGVDVVVAVKQWGSTSDNQPPIAPNIAPFVEFGSAVSFFQAEAPWSVPLLRQRGDTEPAPCLAIAAVAAFQHPRTKAAFVLDVVLEMVTVIYWKSVIGNDRAREWLNETDKIRVSAIEVRTKEDPMRDLLPHDVVGKYLIAVPSDAVLKASTIPYAKVFGASQSELSTWFSGKVVVLGNLAGEDRFDYSDGRKKIPGVYGHAIAIDALLLGVAIGRPTATANAGWTLLGAIVGLGIAFATGGSPWRRGAIQLTIAVLGLVLAIWACGGIRYFINPFVYIIAMIAGCELGAMVIRLRRAPAR